ncbi:MAG: helix-turn-helix domain-containing protein [Oscillospiraceae bacterium]|jgi:IS30 family transposase|nr:helix-turn-helix domain-containing protein [Oscillospiraceae bacterium]
MSQRQKCDKAHLTLEQRKVIQAGIESGATKASIAQTTGKDGGELLAEAQQLAAV